MSPLWGLSPEERNEGMEIIDTRCWLTTTIFGLHNPQHICPGNFEAGATILAGQIIHQVVNARCLVAAEDEPRAEEGETVEDEGGDTTGGIPPLPMALARSLPRGMWNTLRPLSEF